MKQIELEYTEDLSIDLLESILRQRFPDKEVKRQNWGLNSPFLWIKMSFWIKVSVGITQKPKKNKTIVFVNDTYTLGGYLLLGGLIPYLFLRKNHRTDVMDAISDELKQRTNVVFLN